MVDDNKKVALGLGVGLLAVGGLAYALTRKPAPPEERPPAAGIDIKVYDAQGNLVPSNSPLTLTEGESYTVVLTVTNQSTKAGTPWEATLEVVIYAGTDYTTLIPVTARSEYFGAGETRTFSYSMNVPLGTGGEMGNIVATVNDPTGVKLADAIEYFSIEEVPIVYGATVVIG